MFPISLYAAINAKRILLSTTAVRVWYDRQPARGRVVCGNACKFVLSKGQHGRYAVQSCWRPGLVCSGAGTGSGCFCQWVRPASSLYLHLPMTVQFFEGLRRCCQPSRGAGFDEAMQHTSMRTICATNAVCQPPAGFSCTGWVHSLGASDSCKTAPDNPVSCASHTQRLWSRSLFVYVAAPSDFFEDPSAPQDYGQVRTMHGNWCL